MPKRKASKLGYLTKENANEFSIWLYGAVGWEFDSKSFINDINNLPSGVTTLNLYINSPGGLVDEGYAIITNIHRVRQRLTVITHTDAMAYSMASGIAATGDKHIMSPTSRMMIHNPWMFLDIFGSHNSEDLDDLIEWIEGLKDDLDSNTEILAGIYQKRLGMSLEDVLDRFFDGKDHYLSPDECLELGLCDEVAEFEIDDETSEELQDLAGVENSNHDYQIAAFGEDYAEQYLREKKLFDYNFENPEIKSRSKSQSKEETMDALQLAKAMGISEDRAKKMSDEEIITEARKLASEKEELEKEKTTLTEMNEDLKERNTSLESENESLKEKTVNYDAKQVVDRAVKEVEKQAKGKKVNSNVMESLEARAADYVKAESDDEKDQIFDHIKLKAQNAMVPIGQDPDLDDNGKDARGASEEASQEEKFKEAEERGKAKREKREKRLNRRNQVRQ